MKRRKPTRRTRLGRDIEAAFVELRGVLRGDLQADEYETESDRMTAVRVEPGAVRQALRPKAA